MSKSGNLSYLPFLVFCAFIFAFYQFLIYSSPILYWDDPHIRWALRDRLLLERWLPVMQVIVFLSSKITSSLYFLKTIMSLVAIGSLMAVYVLTQRIFSVLAGLVAVLFLAFNMIFAALAIAPYADVLFVGLAFMTFNLLDGQPFTRRFYLGIFFLNLACLTSYAGWFLAIVFIANTALRSFHTLDRKTALSQILKMVILCSLIPVLWLIFGVSEAGNLISRMGFIFEFIAAPAESTLSDHILVRFNPVYLQEFSSQYFELLIRQVGLEFLIFGAIGFLFALSDASHRRLHLIIISFLFLHWCVLAFLQPWRFGSLRQPFVLIVFILFYSAHGLVMGFSWLLQKSSLKDDNLRVLISVLTILILSARFIPSTTKFVVGNLHDPSRLVPFEVGSWFNAHLKAGDVILVLDDTDYYPYALATYMEYPIERLLDDRLDAYVIQETLEAAQMVYVIGLYTSREGLSSTEIRILKDLENGHIQAERFVIGIASLWYVPATEIVYAK